jgi:glc operon protein GlcG
LRNVIRENMRQKFSLTLVEAHAIVTAAKLEAVKNNWNVSIAVVDEGGFLLNLERMDGAPLPSPEIATMKARTAALSKVPTKYLEDVTKERAATMMFPGRLPVQGGLPIVYADECVGAIGVSGVKSPEDEQIANAGLAAFGKN